MHDYNHVWIYVSKDTEFTFSLQVERLQYISAQTDVSTQCNFFSIVNFLKLYAVTASIYLPRMCGHDVCILHINVFNIFNIIILIYFPVLSLQL